ncbi:MAG: hypothetical protein IBX68_08965 [Dehalococcoidia bacterium]|nr:hypothetical protein [Dehalococcoidia bacterium]
MARSRSESVSSSTEDKARRQRKGKAQPPPRHIDTSALSSLLNSCVLGLPAERQAAVLDSARMLERAGVEERAGVVIGLQQSYGNAHVQRILRSVRQRRDMASAPAAPRQDIQCAPGAGDKKGSAGGLLKMRPPESAPDKAQFAEQVKGKSESLLSPSSEQCEELARKWALTWLILQKFPQPEQGPVAQLISALKGKVKESASRGEAYLTDPSRIDEVAGLKAFDDILKRLARPGKEDISAKEMAEAKEKLSEALNKALESTKFFPKWKKNIEEKVKEHWPALALSCAALVGSMVAQAAYSGKWNSVGALAEKLPGLVDKEIEIDKNWKLIVALQESKPIGSEGKGAVIGISPALGLRYTFADGKTMELSGTANFRFATEKSAPFNIRHGAFFGLKGTF